MLQLFNNLSGDGSESSSSTDQSNSENEKKSIFDFFKINLMEIPDDSFVEKLSKRNSPSDSVHFYHSDLNYLECDLFDTIKIVKFNNVKNIFFKSYILSIDKIIHVKKLINGLALLYGPDDNGKGKFTDKDLKSYKSKKSYLFFGRRWIAKKCTYPVALEIDRAGMVLVLSIWGINSK